MSNDADADLRAQLAGIDPVGGLPVDPVTSPRAHSLLERTMQTIDDVTEIAPPARSARWRRPALAAAAVVAIGLGAVVVAANVGGDGATPAPKPPTTLALTVQGGGGGPSLGSCIMFDVNMLRDMPVALAGTVTAVDAGKVTLHVDRWYKGGDADQVTIAQPDGQTSVALDGVSFEQGKRYLVAATEGTVNGCGFSGPATPELQKSYDEAFGG
jgi:hypothetical protein